MSFEELSDSNNVCWKNLKSLGSKQNTTLCKLFPDLKAAQPLAPSVVGWGRGRVEGGLDLRSITAREVMAVAEEQGSPGKESHSVAPKHLGTKDFTSSQQPQQGTRQPVSGPQAEPVRAKVKPFGTLGKWGAQPAGGSSPNQEPVFTS